MAQSSIMVSPSLQQSGVSFLQRTKLATRECGSTRSKVVVCASSESNESKLSTKKTALSFPIFVASIVGVSGSASAVEAEDISAALSQVESLATQVSEQAVESYEFVKGVVDQVVTASKPVVDAATPVVKQAAQKALEAASPIASDVVNKAQQALSDAGLDTAPYIEAAKTAASVGSSVGNTTGKAITEAAPLAQSTLESVLAQDPTILAIGAGALVLLYLLAPSIGSSVVYSARGYAGDLTAAQTLDLLATQDYTIVDVRTEREKSKTGIPALPRSAQNKRFFIPVEDLPNKVRSLLRNPRGVEAELTAIKIASLKKLNKNSKLAILDANGNVSKLVAKSLSKLGFRNVFIVKDGTDGSTGWVQSQLSFDSYRSSAIEVLSPSRVISGTTIFSPRSSSNDVVDVPTGRKGFLLPGSRDD